MRPPVGLPFLPWRAQLLLLLTRPTAPPLVPVCVFCAQARALPPALPMTQIGTDWFWDGGLVSNTPLQWMLDQRPRLDTLALQIDLWVALFLVLAGSSSGPKDKVGLVESPLLGRPAPTVRSTTLDGTPFDLARRKGSWVVVNFFNSTCATTPRRFCASESWMRRRASGGDRSMMPSMAADRLQYACKSPIPLRLGAKNPPPAVVAANRGRRRVAMLHAPDPRTPPAVHSSPA